MVELHFPTPELSMAIIYWPGKCEWESPRIRGYFLCSLLAASKTSDAQTHSHNENAHLNSNGQVTGIEKQASVAVSR